MKAAALILSLLMILGVMHSMAQGIDAAVFERTHIGPKGELIGTGADIGKLSAASKRYLVPPFHEFSRLPLQGQSVLAVAALERKEDRGYLETIALVLDGVANDQLSPEIGGVVLAAPYHDGVLAVNHGDPIIRGALGRAIPHYDQDSEEGKLLRRLVSGEARKDYLEWSSGYGLRAVRPIDGSADRRDRMILAGTAVAVVLGIGCFLFVCIRRRSRPVHGG